MKRSLHAAIAIAIAITSASLAACDPVHSAQVDALGGEAAGVRKGPEHRPGEPCTLCHDGAIGDPQEFSVAGTVYAHPSDTIGLNGANVTMTDASGAQFTASTNQAGNFFITPTTWQPIFPIESVVVSEGGTTATMYSEVGATASCATCHYDPASAASPGQVSLELDDGGTPP